MAPNCKEIWANNPRQSTRKHKPWPRTPSSFCDQTMVNKQLKKRLVTGIPVFPPVSEAHIRGDQSSKMGSYMSKTQDLSRHNAEWDEAKTFKSKVHSNFLGQVNRLEVIEAVTCDCHRKEFGSKKLFLSKHTPGFLHPQLPEQRTLACTAIISIFGTNVHFWSDRSSYSMVNVYSLKACLLQFRSSWDKLMSVATAHVFPCKQTKKSRAFLYMEQVAQKRVWAGHIWRVDQEHFTISYQLTWGF